MKKYIILVFLYCNFGTLNTNPDLDELTNLFNIDCFDLVDPFNSSVYFNEICLGLDFLNEIHGQCIEPSSFSNTLNIDSYKIHVQKESNLEKKSLSTFSENSYQNIKSNNSECNIYSDQLSFNSQNQDETTIKSNQITENTNFKYKLNVSENLNFDRESEDETKAKVKYLDNNLQKIDEINKKNAQDLEKNNIQTNKIISDQNYIFTYDVKTKSISYKSLPEAENTTKKRKIHDLNLGNSSESEEKQDMLQLNSKKMCLETKTLLINEKHETNVILSHFEPSTKNEYSLLDRFAEFLNLVECSFDNFLLKKQDNANLKIQNVLYAPKFIIINKFKTDIYKYNADDASETCKEISTTFDALINFIQEFEYSLVYFDCLIDCVDPNLKNKDVTEVAKKIEFLLFNFLKSTEANYIISFLPQLKSYVNATQKIEINYNENVIKGFIIILFIYKRNVLNFKDFKEKIKLNCDFSEIKNILSGEILINTVFLRVFFEFWPFKNMHNIILNISTIIKVNCAIKDLVLGLRFSNYINLILISEHLFFELVKYEISISDKHLSKNSVRAKFNLKDNKKFQYLFWNLITEINKFKLKEFKKFKKSLESINTNTKLKAKNLEIFKDKNSLCISQIQDLLNLINRYEFFGLNQNIFLLNLFRGSKKVTVWDYFENHLKSINII